MIYQHLGTSGEILFFVIRRIKFSFRPFFKHDAGVCLLQLPGRPVFKHLGHASVWITIVSYDGQVTKKQSYARSQYLIPYPGTHEF